jgi:ATP-dependent metalloprotease FtsH
MFKTLDDNSVNLDKNLKLMSISAIVLVVLFIYTIFKSDTAIHNGSYLIGIGFLFILMFVAFFLQKYKLKLKTNSAFSKELASATSQTKENLRDAYVSKIESVKTDTTFDDVAGIDDIKGELEEIVDFLNNPKKYKKYDVSLPKGVLLVGPPGVGKTLIAKAVAGEAKVPFFYQSGASFVQIYVGMGAKRVKELFNEAKKNAPAIIFIDEIDAVGKSRGSSNDEREATLNELLTQMDGFDGKSGVIVIAATNKIEVLDEALLRAGRFDRRVFLTLPSKEDRKKILNLYLKHKQYEIDIDKLAYDTSGFSSAGLATLVNESLLNMIKNNRSSITQEDIDIAKKKVEFGKKQHKILTPEQKDILVTYQATKAFISGKKVALFDEGLSVDDIIYPSKTQLENMIKANLAGVVGLEVIKNEPYVVFYSELSKAKELAKDMVEKYDMAVSVDNVIQSLKAQLRQTISESANKEKINQLKEQLIEDEVVNS